jgi:outer membrane protein
VLHVLAPSALGFQNINAIRQAKATVQAGREDLRTIEQTTLLDAATAYVNVVRDQAVVGLADRPRLGGAQPPRR